MTTSTEVHNWSVNSMNCRVTKYDNRVTVNLMKEMAHGTGNQHPNNATQPQSLQPSVPPNSTFP